MNHPILPPPYKPSDAEHRSAYMKWCLTDICYNYLIRVSMIDDGSFLKMGGHSARDLAHEREGIIKMLLGRLFSSDADEAWDGLWPADDGGTGGIEAFKRAYAADLSSPHNGDCVAVAGSCARCAAEDVYSLPSSVTWSGKSAGWQLYSEYIKLIKG